MTPQPQIVEEARSCYYKMEDQLIGLRKNWLIMEVPQIRELVKELDEAMNFTDLKLSNLTDKDERIEVEDFLYELHDFKMEAQDFVYQHKLIDERLSGENKEEGSMETDDNENNENENSESEENNNSENKENMQP